MKITYTQHAWLRFGDSIELFKKGISTPLLSSQGPGDGGYFEREGYAPIGTATVTLEIHSDDKVVAGQIASLNAKLQEVRAEAQREENRILLQISKLQALTMDAA